MQKTVNQIVTEIMEDLGTPSTTELATTTVARHWNDAFALFNKRVGEWILEYAKLTANVQTYDITALIADKVIKDVKYVFNGNSVYTKEVNNVTEYYITVAETTTIVSGRDINVITALTDNLSEISFKFIEPKTLILYPPPTEAVNMLMLLQIDYTQQSLPDDYEKIITAYTKAKCQEIVGNARARLNTPMRQGDYITFSKREVSQYDRADAGYEAFDCACNEIIASRLVG